MDKIIIKGARENNLKNINLELPKNKMIVMTGLSGSGKSSLAFDTIYQEGQRRYVESLSAYARQFLGGTEKPDVDFIEGLSPAISIDQKTTSKNPRSTVGTVTEIYDYLRLLFARIGVPHCPTHHEPIQSQSIEEMTEKTLALGEGQKIMVLAPVYHRSKGTYKKEFEQFLKDGYIRARIDGEIKEIEPEMSLEKNKNHNIDLVIDRLVIKDGIRSRLFSSIETATKLADGKVVILCGDKEYLFSEKYACKYCGFSIPELEPRLFSFNSPLGACPDCNGLGSKLNVSEDLVVNKDISLEKGALIPFKNQDSNNLQSLEYDIVYKHFGINPKIPFKELPIEQQKIVLYGSPEIISFDTTSTSGRRHEYKKAFEGAITNLNRRYLETNSGWIRDWIAGYMVESTCPTCLGNRLNSAVLNVLIDGKSIMDVCNMSIDKCFMFLDSLVLSETQLKIAGLLIKEIKNRLSFLINVGLEYLTLSRGAQTLSGGEAQRIRLATQIGSHLTGVLYVLDEPSIGLHQRDNARLIKSLKDMRDLGNTLIIVEHDDEMMKESDYLVDIGPRAGVHGGMVMAAGTPEEVMANPNSITGRYLAGLEYIPVPKERRKGNGKELIIKGARQNNLKNVTVSIPLGKLVVVTGVSGSGKSSLVNEILYKGINNYLYKTKEKPGLFDEIINKEYIERIIDVSQSPIGRTPRSNPATYTGVFDDIRDLFAQTNDAKVRGYEKGRFSFNVKGGRCEACWGDGVKRIQMNFLPDVYVPCEVCHGSRYNFDTLQIKYKGKNIADVLNMTVEDALEFFSNIPKIKDKLQTLYDVGLGYVTLGQSATTLSGGEAQRVKLASELYKRITDKTLYILDEPTTGLHVDDIKRLMVVINRIVDQGASVVIIEHNLDVIKLADHLIDLGPEGGDKGGQIIFTGTPEEIVKCEKSYTGQYLKKVLY